MSKKWTQEELDKLIVGASTVMVNKHEKVRIDRICRFKFIPMKGRTGRAVRQKIEQLADTPHIMRGDCEGCELIDYGRF